MKLEGIKSISQVVIFAAILFAVNVIAHYVNGYIDLTEEKRFTITEPTKKVIRSVDERVIIEVLMEGKFPAEFKRLRNATEEMLKDLRNINPRIEYEFRNPLDGSTEEVNTTKKKLSEEGINPISLGYLSDNEKVNKLLYPYAIINYGPRRVVVNLLESQAIGISDQRVLNNSVSLLEYKFANAFQKLLLTEPQNIVFTSGHEELTSKQTFRLETELRKFYNTGRIKVDSIYYLDQAIDLLIVAGPRKSFDQRSQFKIDQYIMNGGKVIWLIDYMAASLDSISKYKFYVPPNYELGLEDMFFKYGARIQPNLILDLESTQIPQVIGVAGGRPQTEMFRWYYHPLVASKSDHPIVKNIDRVNFTFPSTVDTVETRTNLKKTFLLESSRYSRFQFNPVRLNFQILEAEPDPSKFNKPPQPIALLLEGEFESYFKNRVSSDFLKVLDQIDASFKDKSTPTKQLIISDSDFAKNLIDPNSNVTQEIGYNKWERRTFKGNKDFIINAIEYMLDEEGVLNARSKEVKLRLLDSVRTKAEKTKWQVINIVLPLVFLILFGLMFNYWRNRKYTRI